MTYIVYLENPHYGTPRVDADRVVPQRGLYVFMKDDKEVASFTFDRVIGWVINDD